MILKSEHTWIDGIERIERLDPEEAEDTLCEDWKTMIFTGELLDYVRDDGEPVLGQIPLKRKKVFLKLVKSSTKHIYINAYAPLYVLSNEGKTVDKIA